MNRKAARGALRTMLLTVPGLPADRAWQARKHRPVTGTPFVREALQFPAGAKVSLGAGGLIRQPVVYFIDLFHPITAALADLDDLTDAVLTVFHPGAAILAVGVSGQITSAAAESVRSDAQWHHAPITVRGWYMVAAPTG